MNRGRDEGKVMMELEDKERETEKRSKSEKRRTGKG